MSDFISQLAQEWTGTISGTNSGDFFLQLNCDEEGKVSGILRINDPIYGMNVYKVSGDFDGSSLNLRGIAVASDPNVQLGSISIHGLLQNDHSIVGNWESEILTAGKFSMTPNIDGKLKASEVESEPGRHAETKKLNPFTRALHWVLSNFWSVFLMVIAGLLILYFAPKFGLNG